MSNPLATMVVVPRERFSFAPRTLSSIYKNTPSPFDLIYVDAGGPPPLTRLLEREYGNRGLQLISVPQYLSPNQARNLAWRQVRTQYTVFLDNDALVTPGWLEPLVRCAEETGAWIVGPLYLIGEIEEQTIHMAGGMLHLKEHQGKRVMYDEQYLFGARVADVSVPLERREWDYVEFHCMLVRTDVLDRLGPLDENLLSLQEHIDLCLCARRAGGAVYLEPAAIASYVLPSRCEWWDLPYFMLRWSEAWNVATVRHFNRKWDVAALQWFADKSVPDSEATVIKFGRGHRRFMTGLRIPQDEAEYQPETPLDQARLMVALFSAVDRDHFDLTLTADGRNVVESFPALGVEEIFRRLPEVLRKAETNRLNLAVRPLSDRPSPPALVRLDDLDAAAMASVKRFAFLTLELNPGSYQCWLAVDTEHWRNAAALRKLVGHTDANGSASLYGTPNMKDENRKTDGAYPTVRLVEATTGLMVSAHQLEQSDILPYLASGQMF